MKIRLYASGVVGRDSVSVVDRDLHYLKNVLRVVEGDEVFLFDGGGEWLYRVIAVLKKSILLAREKSTNNKDWVCKVNACIPFIKPETTLKMVRQSVELGCQAVSLFSAQHSSVRPVGLEKVEHAAREALEQCGGLCLPVFTVYESLEKMVFSLKDRLVYANEKNRNTAYTAKEKVGNGVGSVSVVVGPEGGFSDKEIETMSSVDGSTTISLGGRILRSDTALVSAISLARERFLS